MYLDSAEPFHNLHGQREGSSPERILSEYETYLRNQLTELLTQKPRPRGLVRQRLGAGEARLEGGLPAHPQAASRRPRLGRAEHRRDRRGDPVARRRTRGEGISSVGSIPNGGPSNDWSRPLLRSSPATRAGEGSPARG
jgi:hypothetical protein